MTGAEAAEQAANKAEKAANKAEKVAAQSLTPQQDKGNGDNDIEVPRTPRPVGESQGGTTITLALRTPDRPYNLASSAPSEASDASEASDSPESQAQPPASTAPARIERERPQKRPRKRRRMQNKLYRESQYQL